MDWDNKEEVLEAVKKDGYALEWASDRLLSDKDFMLEVVKQNGYALEYTSEELRADKDVVMEAVRSGGQSLYYASEELKANKDIVMEAVKQDGWALQWASDKLKNDKEFLKEIRDTFKGDKYNLQWFDNIVKDLGLEVAPSKEQTNEIANPWDNRMNKSNSNDRGR